MRPRAARPTHRISAAAVAIILVVAVLFSGTGASAQTVESLRARAERIANELEALERRSSELDEQYLALGEELEQLEAERAEKQAGVDEARKLVEQTRSQATGYLVEAYIGAGASNAAALRTTDVNSAVNQRALLEILRGDRSLLADDMDVSRQDLETRGAELGMEYRATENWTFGGSLAYARGEDRDSGRPLPQMPPLEGRFNAGWDNGTWSAGVLLRVVDGQDRVAEGYGNVVGQDIGPSAGFATVALNGGYRFASGVQVTAGVDNLFDRAYGEHLNLAGNADFGYPADPVRINEPGRTFWLRVGYAY